MTISHRKLVQEFIKGEKEHRTNSSLSFDGNVLYSYGTKLMVRMPHWELRCPFILNADRISRATSGHQSYCWRFATVQVPFSALRAAFGSLGCLTDGLLNLLDSTEERWDETGRYCISCGQLSHPSESDTKHPDIGRREYDKLSAEEKKAYVPIMERRPEYALLYYRGKYYLSGMDSGQYFLCQLASKANTVDEALLQLKPKIVKIYEQAGEDVPRQGEWYFIQVVPVLANETKSILKVYYNILRPRFGLPTRGYPSNIHVATRGAEFSGARIGMAFVVDVGKEVMPNTTLLLRSSPIVSGRISHPEHRTLRLSKSTNPKFFVAVRNTAVNSWSARGRVD